jgi:hypothetical protein
MLSRYVHPNGIFFLKCFLFLFNVFNAPNYIVCNIEKEDKKYGINFYEGQTL